MADRDRLFVNRIMIAPSPLPTSGNAAMTEEEIFLQALEIDSENERRAFLDTACAEQPVVRVRIEQLLTSHSAAGDFLLKPPVELLEHAASETSGDETSGGGTSGGETDCGMSDTDGTGSVSRRHLEFLQPCPDGLGRIGHYAVSRVIAEGGTGIVLEALDTRLDRTVALKVLKPECLARAGARERFLQEARAAAAIRNDHVVTIFSVENEEAVPFLAMEYIDGESLQQRVDREGALSGREVRDIGIQIATGLAASHDLGLMHRDVKPANILLEEGTGRARITDFGLARVITKPGDTPPGLMSGTPQFMSPEQAEGRPVNHRSDLFSLGSVLYSLAAGRPPFRAFSSLAVLRRVVETEPQPLSEIRSDLPAALIQLIEQLLKKAPDERPVSAHEVVDALSAIPDPDAENSHSASLQPVAVPAAGQSSVAETDQPPPSGRRLPAWLLFGTPLMALGIITLIIRDNDGTRTKLRFPAGSDVTVNSATEVAVTLPAETASTVSLSETDGKEHAGDESSLPAESLPQEPPRAELPFSPSRAHRLQNEWAEHLNVPAKWTSSIGLQFSLIPPGEFQMGTSQEDVDAMLGRYGKSEWFYARLQELTAYEVPRHRVQISKPYYIATTEVTVGQFRAFVAASGYQAEGEATGIGGVSYAKELVRNASPEWTWQNPGFKQTDEHAVVHITWNDAVAFCEWLSEKERRSVTLPTEAQWEFACRSGSEQRYFFGDHTAPIDRYIVPSGPYGTKPVGQKLPNAFGLFDTCSNAWEWCSDHFSTNYYASSPPVDPPGPTSGASHTLRGGSYREGQPVLGSPCRQAKPPEDFTSDNVGFRVVITGDLAAETFSSAIE